MMDARRLCRSVILMELLKHCVCPEIAAPTHGNFSAQSVNSNTTDDATYGDNDDPHNAPSNVDFPVREANTPTQDADCASNNIKEDLVNISSLNLLIPSCGAAECSNNVRAMCKCDRECILFGDCCYSVIDSMTEQGSSIALFYEAAARVRQESVLGNYSFRCTQDVFHYNHYFMIDECRNLINVSSNDATEHCSSNSMFSYKDMPVDHVLGDRYITTFRNTYCAKCNGIPANELQPWSAQVLCKRFLSENISISPYMTLDEIDAIEDCAIRPMSLYTPRPCDDDIIEYKTCPHISANATTSMSSTLCPMYIYPLSVLPIDEANKSSLTYRNIHCYVCNNETIEMDSFSCAGKTGEELHKPGSLIGEDYKLIDLQVIFDIGTNEARVSTVKCGLTTVCDDNQVFDCISKKCRVIYCPFGKSPRNSKCVDDSNNLLGADTRSPFDTSPLANDGDILIVEVKFTSDGKSEEEIHSLSVIAETFLRKLESLIVEDAIMSIINASTYAILENNRDNETFELAERVFQIVHETTRDNNINFNIFTITLRNYFDKKYLQCSTEDMILSESDVTFDKRNDSVIFNMLSSGMSAPVEKSKWTLAYKHFDRNILFEPVNVHICLADNQLPNMNCTMVAFPLVDVIMEDGLVHILDLDVKLSDEEFVAHNNNVYVCSDIVTHYEAIVDIFEHRRTYRILSIITSSLSVVGVLIVIFAHILKKQLRNAHGLNLTALSISILIIHVLLIAQVSTFSYVICHVYAIVLHAALLIMFTWTNIIGIDMARIFLSDRIISRSNPTKRFLVYLLVSVLFPAVFVTVCASLDYTTVSYRPNYALYGKCWLTNGKGVMAFVVAPVVVSMVMNICCFTITVVSIKRKTMQTKIVSKDTNRTYVAVYLKMSIILGFTWIFGIVGSVWEQTWLSILNIILNGLQGFSILICSFVNARNVRQFRETIKSSYNTNEKKLNGVTAMTNSGGVDKDAT